jgi:hypothetical protein
MWFYNISVYLELSLITPPPFPTFLRSLTSGTQKGHLTLPQNDSNLKRKKLSLNTNMFPVSKLRKGASLWGNFLLNYSICFKQNWSTANFVYNDHPRNPKIVSVVDRWSLFRGSFMLQKLKAGLHHIGRYRQVVAIRRWLWAQVWLYIIEAKSNS